jgi:hypothetical protein
MDKQKYGLCIGVRVNADQEARLVQFQRQLAERNPDVKVTLTRATSIVLAKAIEALPATTKDATD